MGEGVGAGSAWFASGNRGGTECGGRSVGDGAWKILWQRAWEGGKGGGDVCQRPWEEGGPARTLRQSVWKGGRASLFCQRAWERGRYGSLYERGAQERGNPKPYFVSVQGFSEGQLMRPMVAVGLDWQKVVGVDWQQVSGHGHKGWDDGHTKRRVWTDRRVWRAHVLEVWGGRIGMSHAHALEVWGGRIGMSCTHACRQRSWQRRRGSPAGRWRQSVAGGKVWLVGSVAQQCQWRLLDVRGAPWTSEKSPGRRRGCVVTENPPGCRKSIWSAGGASWVSEELVGRRGCLAGRHWMRWHVFSASVEVPAKCQR
eukprot:365251-Chlamydomonas_euryale.AAC.2